MASSLDNGLTPEEQRFFETGQLEASLAQPPEQPLLNQVDIAALNKGHDGPASISQTPPAVIPPVVTPPAVPPTEQSLPDMAEILRRNLAEAQQRVAELEQQMRIAQKPATPDPGPDPSLDPLGALMHKLETVQAEIKGMQTQQTQLNSQQQQLVAFQAFQSNVNSLKAEFVKTAPDFDAAYSHLRATRINDLKIFGLNEKQINETLFREELALAESAINSGRNPAAVVYEMSKRHGYTPSTASASPQTPTTPAAKLDAIQAAQAAAKSLASQHTPNSDITLEGLKAASETDLNQIVLDPKLWGKIAGSNEYPL